MAHEILSVKLCELDERFASIHSRIQMSELNSVSQLQPEVETLKKECTEHEMSVCGSLKRSKAAMPTALLSAYEQIEQIVHTTLDSLRTASDDREDAEMSAEKLLLLAEYELDFTMLAADRALLIALEAIERQLAHETEGEKTK